MFPSPSSSRTAVPSIGNRGLLWLLGAVLLFLLQALPYLSYRWVTDESWYAGPAFTIAHGDGVRDPGIGPNDGENHFDGRPPGTFAVMATSFRVFGTSAATARLGSVAAGTLGVVLLFLLTREALGGLGAAFASFLLATDNLYVLVSRNARPEALTILMVLLALLALKQYADRRHLAWALLAGLLLAAGTSFHVTLLGFVLSLGLLAAWTDRRAGVSPLRGAGALLLGWLVGLAPMVLWFAATPAHRAGFHEEFLKRAAAPLPARIVGEVARYGDLFGTHTLPGALHGIPARLPVPLLLLAATFLLWRHRRTWFYVELALLLPTMLWFAYTANKSSRYLSLLAPIFALTIAAAVADAFASRRRGWKVLSVCAVAIILMQLGANLLLLRGSAKADYTRVEAQLRQLIPPDQTAYGTITFWLGLRDGRFIAYERTTPEQAIRDFGARYFIVGDPMMRNGSETDKQFYDDLNASVARVEDHSTRLGVVHSSYYGDLSVYRVDDPGAVLATTH